MRRRGVGRVGNTPIWRSVGRTWAAVWAGCGRLCRPCTVHASVHVLSMLCKAWFSTLSMPNVFLRFWWVVLYTGNVATPRLGTGRGCCELRCIASFIAAVAVNVVSHLIDKWLDSRRNGN